MSAEGTVTSTDAPRATRIETRAISGSNVMELPGTIASLNFSLQIHQKAENAAPNGVVHIEEFGFNTGYENNINSLVFFLEMDRAQSSLVALLPDLSPESALECAHSLTTSLAQIHAADIVHLDIKPGNILVMKDGSVRWTDFGASNDLKMGQEASKAEEASPLEAIAIKRYFLRAANTPVYAPPESLGTDPNPDLGTWEDPMMGKTYDVFSLGCVLWQLAMKGDLPETIQPRRRFSPGELVDRAPEISSRQHQAMVDRVQSGAIQADPRLKPLLEVACRCLHPDRHQRPANAGVVLDLLNKATPSP
ncbi:MAG: protein kinase domain-containing protein [Chlamydiia bacterium]